MKLFRTLSLAGVIAVAILFCLFLETLIPQNTDKDPTAEVSVLEKDQYNGNGLEGDTLLSGTVIYEDEQRLVYSDRVLQKFNYDSENATHLRDVLNGVKQAVPQLEEIYVVPVPLRVFLEEGKDFQKELYTSYWQELATQLSGTASLVDVLPALEASREEYLFYRTENAWTARGAYYGANILCEKLGISPLSLDAYEEHMYNSYIGSLVRSLLLDFSQDQEMLNEVNQIPSDKNYYYILPNGKNREKVEQETEKGSEWILRQTIAQSATGLDTFIGGVWLRAVVEGDGKSQEKKDQAILLVCDESGKMLAPYLANYYKEVYLVNVINYKMPDETLEEIVREYGIKELVLAQNCSTLGNPGYSSALNGFVNQGE